MSFITTKFHEILLSGFREVALTRKTVVSFILAKFLSSKRALTPRKKIESNMHIYVTSISHYVLHIYKVSGNSVEWF